MLPLDSLPAGPLEPSIHYSRLLDNEFNGVNRHDTTRVESREADRGEA